jgi:hypothetical protein
MTEVAASSPCGYCGTAIVPGLKICPRCGIRLIDVTRHHWGYDSKEAVLEALDRAGDKARAALRTPEARRAATHAAIAAGMVSAAMIGFKLLRKRRV